MREESNLTIVEWLREQGIRDPEYLAGILERSGVVLRPVPTREEQTSAEGYIDPADIPKLLGCRKLE